jgi:hypothetical protein
MRWEKQYISQEEGIVPGIGNLQHSKSKSDLWLKSG